MANLSVTTLCSRACSFCFAAGTTTEPSAARHVTRDRFAGWLAQLAAAGRREARLLGGEPSLHPHFGALVDQAVQAGFEVLVFTNGEFPPEALAAVAEQPPERVSVLVNLGRPEVGRLPAEPLLRALGPRVALGVTLSGPDFDAAAYLDLIDRYGLQRCLRLGLAQGAVGGDNRWLPPDRYAAVGHRLAELAPAFRARGIQLDFDCGFVPCMFPTEPEALFGPSAHGLGQRCAPIPDLLPDGSAIACYPLARLAAVAPRGDPLEQVVADLGASLAPYQGLTVYATCASCQQRAEGLCRGGCLATAARLRLRGLPVLNGRPAAAPVPAGEPARPTVPLHLPYIDQPPEWWAALAAELGPSLGAVYCPVPPDVLATGRPRQPDRHLSSLWQAGAVPISLLVNLPILHEPAIQVGARVCRFVDGLRQQGTPVIGLTVANLGLAEVLQRLLPGVPLTASTLLDIATPYQAEVVREVFAALVPASRIVRDLAALRALRRTFPGTLRLLVNEACLPGCPYRNQHFHDLAYDPRPATPCDRLLARQPWLRLTGAWIPPQFLHHYDGLYDELKLAGRVTLQSPDRFHEVVDAYRRRTPLAPDRLGGGPASPLAGWSLSPELFACTLRCDRDCAACGACERELAAMSRAEPVQ